MKNQIILVAFACTLMACQNRDVNTNNSTDSQKVHAASKTANNFFDKIYEEALEFFPVEKSYLGRKEDNDKWDDMSEAHNERIHEFCKNVLKRLDEEVDYNALDEQTKLSYKLFKKEYEKEIADYEFRYNDYPVNQMFGLHSHVPSFLISIHGIDNEEDAKAYIARLNGVPTMFDQLKTGLDKRAEIGVIPPKFVFGRVLDDCKNIISGFPLEKTEDDNAIYADFEKKVKKLDIDGDKQKTLINDCANALENSVKPAYKDLINYLSKLEEKATADDGVWKFKNGETYFSNRLSRITTTDLTADQIHQIGLEEVKRIHGEMTKIKDKVGFDGTLQEFFVFMREDEQFYYPNTDKGKADYMKRATEIINDMRSELDKLFITKPKAEMVVKAVEKYREKSAGKAFYNSPAEDGSRPGIYYANTYNMEDMPKYQMEALAYHEGIPGHHMQLSIAQEMKGLPMFRRFGSGYTAYVEGWGLYTEYLPKELGYYSDPYSDFGRLAMELWRACRLVVDTGIHAQKWTREKGIDYYMTNTPNSKGDAVKMVERHIVMPGQATAYKIGMIKILELRSMAQKQLGDKFDIREFHEVVLTNGALPLDVLEDLVKDYITKNS